MRSVYAKILVWALGILLFSMAAFLVISRNLSYGNFDDPESGIARNAAIQFEAAKQAFLNGGKSGLDTYLESQHFLYPKIRFFFLDKGRDLVTGADRSRLLAMARSAWTRFSIGSPVIVAVPSAGSEQALIVYVSAENALRYWPYFLLLLAVIALLCWALTFQFASPLNNLSGVVRRFGAGDLTVRVNSRRHDEIGDVGRAFDQMANRIETLLTAERRLLQDISHELRSPLARLSFAAELARTSSDREGAALRVNKEIERLVDLVESLLEVTRAEGDPAARTLTNVAFDELIRELIEDCGIEAAARNCRFILKGSSALNLRADPELLRRAIENILRNAIRHAPAGSEIDVTLQSGAANASLSVRDYGSGVPADALANIFRPFFRVDSSRDTATGGVGLGLAIAQRAILVHHGQVRAENAEPGLRVSIDLPLEIPA